MKIVLILFLLLAGASTCFAEGDPTDTSSILIEHGKRIDLIQTDLDFVWVLLCAILVFFMQAGFMALESGMARSKNSINVAIKNLTDFVLGVIGFWLIGFGLMFGKSWHGLFGVTDFIVNVESPWTAVFFIFQAVFVGTAATIDSGAICGRAKLKQYILLSFLLSIVIYPIFGHWAWGSFLHGTDPVTGGMGWLEARGFKDFAGSSVVHSVGGWMSLAGVIVVGPRIGRFLKDPKTEKLGKAQKIHPGDMRFVFLGTLILFFSWFGFNCGSTLTASPDIAIIALNTTLAACFGCLVSSLLSWFTHPEKKIEGEMIANGVLAGLVAITAGCAFVDAVSSVIIGAVAGAVVFFVTMLLERVLKLDDVVGAIPVHGFCGLWGTLAVGFFIRPELLGDLTRLDQIKVQFLGAGVCFLWAFGLGFLFYFLVDKLTGGIRVSPEEEILGLNIAEHGATSSIIELANTMHQLTSSGNFSEDVEVAVENGTEIGDLAILFNKMIVRVREGLQESQRQSELAKLMLKESETQKANYIKAQQKLEVERRLATQNRQEYIHSTQDKVHSVTAGIEDMKEMMSETSKVSREMKDSFTTLVATLQDMLESLGGIYTELDNMNSIADVTTATAQSSKITVEDLVQVTGDIGDMVLLINEIAEKTHLLSINSSIEAARTGAAGKGFVVIAEEIRNLSRKTSETATNIGHRLGEVDRRVNKVTEALGKILEVVEEIHRLNSTIIEIVDTNKKLSEDVSLKSSDTITAVESVSVDIEKAVEEADHLSSMGKQVEKDLEDID